MGAMRRIVRISIVSNRTPTWCSLETGGHL